MDLEEAFAALVETYGDIRVELFKETELRMSLQRQLQELRAAGDMGNPAPSDLF